MITRANIGKTGDTLFKCSLILFIVSVPLSIAITEGTFWLAMIGFIMNRWGDRKPLLCATGVEKPIIAFFAALVFTSFFSIKPLHSLHSIDAFRFFILYYMIASYGLGSNFIKRLVTLIILMVTIWSGYEIFRHLLTRSLRLNIYTAHINVLVIPMVVGLISMGQLGKKIRVFLFLSLIILSTASFFSLSRASWLGTSASVALILFYQNWKVLLALTSAMLIVAFIVALCCPDSTVGGLINSIIKPFHHGGARFGSNMGRLQMIKNTVLILKKDIFTGIGPETYRYIPTVGEKHIRISMDHVQILATCGLIGFAAYTWLIYAFIRRGIRIERAWRNIKIFDLYHVLSICLLAAFIGFLVCGSFEPMFFSTRRFRFIMLLLGINECLFKISKYETEDDKGDTAKNISNDTTAS